MAIHPELDIVATGQQASPELDEGKKPNAKGKMVEVGDFRGKMSGDTGKLRGVAGKLVPIYIWRASTREVIVKIYGFHRGQIRGLKFSPDGKKLLSTSDLGGTAIYNWANGTKLADCNGGPCTLNWKTDDEFAMGENNNLSLYIHNGTSITAKKCTLG